jgi:hypothetical protein
VHCCIALPRSRIANMTESNPFLKGNIIDGKAVAAQLRLEIAERVKELKEQYGKV